MKANLFAAAVLSMMALSACSLVQTKEEEVLVVMPEPEPKAINHQSIILLQHKTNGKMACCKDTDEVTAEECAQALERHCFVRVQDFPTRPAEYDFLKADTYPSRRWRENEEAPRW